MRWAFCVLLLVLAAIGCSGSSQAYSDSPLDVALQDIPLAFDYNATLVESRDVQAPACGPSSGTASRRVGYYQSWNTRRFSCNRVRPNQLNFDGFTHVVMAAISIDPETFEVHPMHFDDAALYDEFLTLPNSVSKWIGIGGREFSELGLASHTWSNMSSTEQNRKAFIGSLSKFLSRYKFHGVDIDWQWPSAADKRNQVDLVTEMRQALGENVGISVVVPLQTDLIRNIDTKSLEAQVDWLTVRAYGLHGYWESPSAGIKAHADLKEIDTLLQGLWASNVNPSKIHLGISNFARGYTLADKNCKVWGCPFTGPNRPGNCTGQPGLLSECEVIRVVNDGLSSPWKIIDGGAQTNSLSWDDQWIAFDDGNTRRIKTEFANNRCMGGTSLWAIDFWQCNTDSHPPVVPGPSNVPPSNAPSMSATSVTSLSAGPVPIPSMSVTSTILSGTVPTLVPSKPGTSGMSSTTASMPVPSIPTTSGISSGITPVPVPSAPGTSNMPSGTESTPVLPTPGTSALSTVSVSMPVPPTPGISNMPSGTLTMPVPSIPATSSISSGTIPAPAPSSLTWPSIPPSPTLSNPTTPGATPSIPPWNPIPSMPASSSPPFSIPVPSPFPPSGAPSWGPTPSGPPASNTVSSASVLPIPSPSNPNPSVPVPSNSFPPISAPSSSQSQPIGTVNSSSTSWGIIPTSSAPWVPNPSIPAPSAPTSSDPAPSHGPTSGSTSWNPAPSSDASSPPSSTALTPPVPVPVSSIGTSNLVISQSLPGTAITTSLSSSGSIILTTLSLPGSGVPSASISPGTSLQGPSKSTSGALATSVAGSSIASMSGSTPAVIIPSVTQSTSVGQTPTFGTTPGSNLPLPPTSRVPGSTRISTSAQGTSIGQTQLPGSSSGQPTTSTPPSVPHSTSSGQSAPPFSQGPLPSGTPPPSGPSWPATSSGQTFSASPTPSGTNQPWTSSNLISVPIPPPSLTISEGTTIRATISTASLTSLTWSQGTSATPPTSNAPRLSTAPWSQAPPSAPWTSPSAPGSVWSSSGVSSGVLPSVLPSRSSAPGVSTGPWVSSGAPGSTWSSIGIPPSLSAPASSAPPISTAPWSQLPPSAPWSTPEVTGSSAPGSQAPSSGLLTSPGTPGQSSTDMPPPIIVPVPTAPGTSVNPPGQTSTFAVPPSSNIPWVPSSQNQPSIPIVPTTQGTSTANPTSVPGTSAWSSPVASSAPGSTAAWTSIAGSSMPGSSLVWTSGTSVVASSAQWTSSVRATTPATSAAWTSPVGSSIPSSSAQGSSAPSSTPPAWSQTAGSTTAGSWVGTTSTVIASSAPATASASGTTIAVVPTIPTPGNSSNAPPVTTPGVSGTSLPVIVPSPTPGVSGTAPPTTAPSPTPGVSGTAPPVMVPSPATSITSSTVAAIPSISVSGTPGSGPSSIAPPATTPAASGTAPPVVVPSPTTPPPVPTVRPTSAAPTPTSWYCPPECENEAWCRDQCADKGKSPSLDIKIPVDCKRFWWCWGWYGFKIIKPKCKLLGCGCGWMGLPFGKGCNMPSRGPEDLIVSIHGLFTDPCEWFGCNGGCGVLGCDGYCDGPEGCDECPPALCPKGGPKIGPNPNPRPPLAPGKPTPTKCGPEQYVTATDRMVYCGDFKFLSSALSMTTVFASVSTFLSTSQSSTTQCFTPVDFTFSGCNIIGRQTTITTSMTFSNSLSSEAPACTRAPLSLDDDEGPNDPPDWLSSSSRFASNFTSFFQPSTSMRSAPSISSPQQPSKTTTDTATSISSVSPPSASPGFMDRYGQWKIDCFMWNQNDWSKFEWKLYDPNGFEAGVGEMPIRQGRSDYSVYVESKYRVEAHSMLFGIDAWMLNPTDPDNARLNFRFKKQMPNCGNCSPYFTTENRLETKMFEVDSCYQSCPKGQTITVLPSDINCQDLNDSDWYDTGKGWERKFKCWFRGY